MSDFITPTVGRVVWFYPSSQVQTAGFEPPAEGQPLAAVIAHVWSDRLVNLAVFDACGTAHARTSVPLLHSNEAVPAAGYYSTWMPFQKGQARAQAAAQADSSVAAEACKAQRAEPATTPLAINQRVNDALKAATSGAAFQRPSRREQLEAELVAGAARTLAECPHAAKSMAEAIKEFLNVLHPLVSPNLINLPPLAAGSTIDVVVSEPGDTGRLTSYKLEPKAGVATAITCDTSAALPPATDAHMRNVLYGAIRDAMAELGELHPGFNDHVNRAWNHLHRAYWCEVPAPASSPGLRDELPAAEPGIDLSPTKQQDASAGLIQVEGVTAPRVSQVDVEDEIVKSTYFVFPDTTLTVCCIHLRNGFPVVGESACVSRKNFDPARGRELAYEDAKRKIWPLMGYALKQRLRDAQGA